MSIVQQYLMSSDVAFAVKVFAKADPHADITIDTCQCSCLSLIRLVGFYMRNGLATARAQLSQHLTAWVSSCKCSLHQAD